MALKTGIRIHIYLKFQIGGTCLQTACSEGSRGSWDLGLHILDFSDFRFDLNFQIPEGFLRSGTAKNAVPPVEMTRLWPHLDGVAEHHALTGIVIHTYGTCDLLRDPGRAIFGG